MILCSTYADVVVVAADSSSSAIDAVHHEVTSGG
jgi:hypothetical protein